MANPSEGLLNLVEENANKAAHLVCADRRVIAKFKEGVLDTQALSDNIKKYFIEEWDMFISHFKPYLEAGTVTNQVLQAELAIMVMTVKKRTLIAMGIE